MTAVSFAMVISINIKYFLQNHSGDDKKYP
jgi:hypothetical protein